MYTARHTVLDLFCGAGGLSLGFTQAGFDIVCAVDYDRTALETYALNIKHQTVKQDLSNHTSLPASSLIIGGPPCQGFSSSGLRRYNDRRNTLVGRFAQIVAELRPKCFLFENVEGFLTAEHGDRIIDLLDPLIEAGYHIHLRKVNAANYGVPQHRKRVIAIGGLGWAPSFPEPSHAAYGAPGAERVAQHLPRTPDLLSAILDLPEPATESPGVPQGHHYRPLQGVELARAKALLPGQTMKDLPLELQHESFQRRAFRRVMDGMPSELRGGAPAGIKRLKPHEPSKAITGGTVSEFLHPTEHRPLTIRECARLQTFPDDFVFAGTASEQMQLIGNAVPPLLAKYFAFALMRDLQSPQLVGGDGRLLSFVPTVASGVSPVLRSVIERVQQRYMRGFVVERHTLWD